MLRGLALGSVVNLGKSNCINAEACLLGFCCMV